MLKAKGAVDLTLSDRRTAEACSSSNDDVEEMLKAHESEVGKQKLLITFFIPLTFFSVYYRNNTFWLQI